MIAQDLLNDPGYLAYKFNFETETVAFLPVERDAIVRASALEHGQLAPGAQFVEVPLADIAALLDAPGNSLADNPPRFIFHTAFCASTFLSRCLHVDDMTFSLREPHLLLDAANAKRLRWQSRSTALGHADLPRLALLLLQKHAAPGEKLIIKPVNSVNNIIPELLEATGMSRSLMLYTDARNFILSTLKKGEGGKQTVRSMFDLLRNDFLHLAGLQLTHTIHMTDLRISMTLWRLQLEQAEAALRQFAAQGAMASLYGERLIEDPRAVLHAVNAFLELGIPHRQIDAVVDSDARHTDAKDSDRKFSLEQREAEYQPLRDVFGADMNDGLEWLVRNNPGTQLLPELSCPLSL